MKTLKTFLCQCIFTTAILSHVDCGQSPYSIRSSCDLEAASGSTKWSKKNVQASLKSWMRSITTVPEKGQVHSAKYDTTKKKLFPHSTGYLDFPVAEARGSERSVILVVNSQGLGWRSISRYSIDGYIYGKAARSGEFTGENITFVYPDFLSGIQGTFNDGNLIEGREVKIVAHRCRRGIKEIKTKVLRPGVIWKPTSLNKRDFSKYAKNMDPFERRSLRIGKSRIPMANEGVFSRRSFVPGELVSYFVGLKTTVDQFIFENQTEEEYEKARSYYFQLGSNVPKVWKVPDDEVVDMPVGYRAIEQFRTSLGHKVNHKFKGVNGFFDVVLHPVFGPLPCIIASTFIKRGDELYVNYNYNLKWAPEWYRAQHARDTKTKGSQEIDKDYDYEDYSEYDYVD